MSEVIYLVVKLASTLQWNEHTSYITGKVDSRLGYVARTILATLPHLRDTAYKQLVRPIMKHSSSVWDSSLTTTSYTKSEAMQLRAACHVHNIKRKVRVPSTTAPIIDDLE